MRSLRGLITGRHFLGRNSGTWQVERFWKDLGGRGRPYTTARSRRVWSLLSFSLLSSTNWRWKLGPFSLQCPMILFDPILNSPPAPLLPSQDRLISLATQGAMVISAARVWKSCLCMIFYSKFNINVITFFVFFRHQRPLLHPLSHAGQSRSW